jgi:hypothetical protein
VTRRESISDVEGGLLEAFKILTSGYNDIIFVKSEGRDALQADGIRDTDKQFAQRIEHLFERLLMDNFGDRVCVQTYGNILTSGIRVGDDGKISLDCERCYELVS